MKVTVTHLKAPWPAGTLPGHVVELAGVEKMPTWAIGKCEPAAEDAEAQATWEPKAAEAEQAAVKPALPPELLAAIAEAVQPLEAKLAEQAAVIESLQALVPASVGELVVNPAGDEAPAAAAPAAQAKASKAKS